MWNSNEVAQCDLAVVMRASTSLALVRIHFVELVYA